MTVEQVRRVVQEELDGPGKLLGYRAMHNKVRQVHKLKVLRQLVYNVMYDLDPGGLERRVVGRDKPRRKGRLRISN